MVETKIWANLKVGSGQISETLVLTNVERWSTESPQRCKRKLAGASRRYFRTPGTLAQRHAL